MAAALIPDSGRSVDDLGVQTMRASWPGLIFFVLPVQAMGLVWLSLVVGGLPVRAMAWREWPHSSAWRALWSGLRASLSTSLSERSAELVQAPACGLQYPLGYKPLRSRYILLAASDSVGIGLGAAPESVCPRSGFPMKDGTRIFLALQAEPGH